MRPRSPGLLLLVLLLSPASVRAAEPLSLDAMFEMKRIASPDISPDGKLVAYAQGEVSLKENNSTSRIWLAPTGDGAPRRLTGGPKHDTSPRFSPDGRQVLFQSDRSGDHQLWIIDLEGGEARQLTSIATEASNGLWSPDGKWVAFVSAVYPEYSNLPYAKSNAANKKRIAEIKKNPVKARVFDKLFYRHWDSWVEGKRQHLFVVPAVGGEPRDVTPGDWDAYPTSSTFSAGEDFCFSPDSQALLFTAPPLEDEAWSTNHDIYRVAIEGDGPPVNLTSANQAADSGPQFSPNGKHIAYRMQEKAGYEADRWQLMLMPAGGGEAKSLTAEVDLSVASFVWADDDTIYFSAEKDAGWPIFKLSLGDGKVSELVSGGSFGSATVSDDGKLMACRRSTLNAPAEVVVVDPEGQWRDITHANQKLLAGIEMHEPESVTVSGAGGTPMQMWIIRPPGFTPERKWPLVYLVHGGPQGAWDDSWSYRWNPQLWAAQGYVVALPNPRGSTGFGQQYVDEISGDWGGKVFEDLMAGVAYLEKLPYVDTDRMAAAGASFGGYMMNWFEGHTDKFKTLITHCGVYNFDSMYATTDELWFDEWEHGGPPWGNRESYEKFSPHLFAENFKTPMLIIHNDQDFRVPVAEGYQLFTTLQRLGIPSKMINFPDEGHWVLKPANSAFWHREVFDWLKEYVPPGGR